MHEALVARVRYHIQKANFMGLKEAESTLLLGEAADAIEQLIEECDAYRKAMTDEHNRAAKLAWEKEHCWIPVADRLPIGGDDSGAICENVCLLMDDGTVSCGWMNGITKKVYYLNARDDVVIKAPITRVTHWMPLPPAPKEAPKEG